MNIRYLVGRVSVAGLSLLALVLGLALGSTACCGDPPEPIDIVPGTYVIVRSEMRPELLAGLVDVQLDGVIITYTYEGIDWTIEYMIE